MADGNSSDGLQEIVVYSQPKSSKGVQLYVGGSIYSRWTDIDITRSIETIAGTFDLTLAQKTGGIDELAAVQPGASCRVDVDGETVITGYVDETAVSYDETSHTINIKGRDATGDLVDCSAPFVGGDLIGRDPLDVITQICQPFGIDVRSDVSDFKPLQRYTIEPGTTAFDALSAIAAYAAVLPTSDGMGNLVLTRAGTGPSFADLQLSANINAARSRFSAKDRFSDYLVLGQSAANGQVDPADAYSLSGKAQDSGVSRYRPLTILANFQSVDKATFELRAQWEMAVRAGRAVREDLTVKGWRDSGGQLWKPNGTVKVQDDFVGFNDTLVIAAVKYGLSKSGTTTVLSVTRRGAFSLIEQPLPGNYYDTQTDTGHIFPQPSTKGGQL